MRPRQPEAGGSAGQDARAEDARGSKQPLEASLCGIMRGGAPGRRTTGAAELERYRAVGQRLRAILAAERRLHASIRFPLVASPVCAGMGRRSRLHQRLLTLFPAP